jgi:hypothetical protein
MCVSSQEVWLGLVTELERNEWVVDFDAKIAGPLCGVYQNDSNQAKDLHVDAVGSDL